MRDAGELLDWLPQAPAEAPCRCEECGCRKILEWMTALAERAAADPSPQGRAFAKLLEANRAAMGLAMKPGFRAPGD